MRYVISLLCGLILSAAGPAASLGDTGDLSRVIDHFVAKRFPDAQSRLWIVNQTEWGAEDEVVVDLNTIVTQRHQNDPTEERFLLLIVAGELVATQRVPLGAKVECRPEELI